MDSIIVDKGKTLIVINSGIEGTKISKICKEEIKNISFKTGCSFDSPKTLDIHEYLNEVGLIKNIFDSEFVENDVKKSQISGCFVLSFTMTLTDIFNNSIEINSSRKIEINLNNLFNYLEYFTFHNGITRLSSSFEDIFKNGSLPLLSDIISNYIELIERKGIPVTEIEARCACIIFNLTRSTTVQNLIGDLVNLFNEYPIEYEKGNLCYSYTLPKTIYGFR